MATSPCVGVCRLDPKGAACLGCGRTMAEIAAWPDLSEAERKAIVERLRPHPGSLQSIGP
jgi:uncharacterized protein